MGGRGSRFKQREITMRRVLAILACGFTVAGCASGSDALKSATPTTTLQFESEPAGAEVKTSTGQTCKTPCALAVPAADLMASYALKGYKPQTVPVKLVPPRIRAPIRKAPRPPRFRRSQPSPVYAELEKAGPERKPAPRRPRPAAQTCRRRRRRAPAAQPAPARQPAAAPAPSCCIALAACPEPADAGSLTHLRIGTAKCDAEKRRLTLFLRARKSPLSNPGA